MVVGPPPPLTCGAGDRWVGPPPPCSGVHQAICPISPEVQGPPPHPTSLCKKRSVVPPPLVVDGGVHYKISVLSETTPTANGLKMMNWETIPAFDDDDLNFKMSYLNERSF